jgi:hypothetical protein
MEVRRQLLPVSEVCEDGQHGCAMDGAASPTDEAGAIHGGREGMKTRYPLWFCIHLVEVAHMVLNCKAEAELSSYQGYTTTICRGQHW